MRHSKGERERGGGGEISPVLTKNRAFPFFFPRDAHVLRVRPIGSSLRLVLECIFNAFFSFDISGVFDQGLSLALMPVEVAAPQSSFPRVRERGYLI